MWAHIVIDIHDGRLRLELFELLVRIHIDIVLERLRQRESALILVLSLIVRRSGTCLRVEPRDCYLEVVDNRSKLLRDKINICAKWPLENDVHDQCLRPCVSRAI